MNGGGFMLRIAICDDERKYLDLAQSMIDEYLSCHDYLVHVSTFQSSFELIDSIEKGVLHDIYLLDIYMPVISGMSVAAELRKRDIKSPIIFLTTSKDHALEAFGVGATQYLVKPYQKNAFFEAMDKSFAMLSKQPRKYLFFKIEGEYRNIPANKIVYSETNAHYQQVVLDDETVTVRITSSELFSYLREYNCFYQCGKAYIVSLPKISKITGNSVVMSNGHEIFVPKSSIAGLRSAYFDYFETI